MDPIFPTNEPNSNSTLCVAACSAPEVEQLASTSPPPTPSRARHATAATRSGLGRRARGTTPPSEICPPAAAMASAHEEAAAWSEEAARRVWGGAVPLQVHLHDADVTALPPPPPFLVCHTPPPSPPSERTGCCCCPLVAVGVRRTSAELAPSSKLRRFVSKNYWSPYSILECLAWL